jgi:CRISPR type III-A-associated protein Csm2
VITTKKDWSAYNTALVFQEILEEKKMSNLAEWIEKSALDEARKWEAERLSKTKARKFYSEVKRIQRKLETIGDTKFQELLPEIKLIIPKAVYDSNRSGNRLPNSVKDFIQTNVTAIKNAKDFNEFAMKFEAVIGFARLNN